MGRVLCKMLCPRGPLPHGRGQASGSVMRLLGTKRKQGDYPARFEEACSNPTCLDKGSLIVKAVPMPILLSTRIRP